MPNALQYIFVLICIFSKSWRYTDDIQILILVLMYEYIIRDRSCDDDNI